jgi:hypothetical protein
MSRGSSREPPPGCLVPWTYGPQLNNLTHPEHAGSLTGHSSHFQHKQGTQSHWLRGLPQPWPPNMQPQQLERGVDCAPQASTCTEVITSCACTEYCVLSLAHCPYRPTTAQPGGPCNTPLSREPAEPLDCVHRLTTIFTTGTTHTTTGSGDSP